MAVAPEERRILLERLNLKTSTSDIERFFTKWGPLSECIVMFDKNTRRSRGYGFICFVWDHHCEECLEAQPHSIDGVQIEMRPVKSISSNPIIKYVSTRKILVSFLGARLMTDDIEEYFSKFGAVHVDYAVDTLNEKPLYFAYITFDEVESCDSCINIGEHCISGHHVFIRKVIRREDLKKAEQMERVRAVCEARIQEELQEEAEKKRRYLNRKLREKYATELALLRPPPPPPPAATPSRETADVSSSSSSNWVPLLPNEQLQEDGASYLAGYGPQRQKHKECSTFQGSLPSGHPVGTGTSQWIPLPHGNIPAPSDVVRRYSTPSEAFNNRC
uniref:RRM domain-containing protein n=1 Tax=Setaria digitata TaxID=48799 RepID=A0A915PH77_9BILA